MKLKQYIKYLIAATLTVIAVILVVSVAKKVSRKTDVKETISLIIEQREKLAELVTYRYSRDTILFETEAHSGIFSRFVTDPDTVAVFLARPTICAGINLQNLSIDDFVIKGDTLFVSLPAPEVLDVYVNHSDINMVYSSKFWELDDNLSAVAERAKSGLRRDALRQGILQKAGEQAERSLADFLSQLCRMPVVVECNEKNSITLDNSVIFN
jgi:hypothetical protein